MSNLYFIMQSAVWLLLLFDTDEIDSYMYQSVGHHAIDMYAEAIGLPLFRRTITGSAVMTDKDYTEHPDDEVEDLFQLLQDVQVFQQFQISNSLLSLIPVRFGNNKNTIIMLCLWPT